MNYEARFTMIYIFSGVGLVVVIVIILGILHFCEATRCETRAGEMKLEYVYSLTSGCRVKLKDRTVPMDQLRFFENGRIEVEAND